MKKIEINGLNSSSIKIKEILIVLVPLFIQLSANSYRQM